MINDTTNAEWQQLTFGHTQKLSYPQGTNLHTLYFTTVYEDTPFLGQGRSWYLTNLLYNILRASYYFCLAKKSFYYS